MKLKSLIFAAVALLLASPLEAAQVPNVTGPLDPANALLTFNQLVQSINNNVAFNAVPCIASGASGQTCNGLNGQVTTNSLSTAAATDATYTITDSSVGAANIIYCTIAAYSGTYGTNGDPIIESCVATSTTITVNLRNVNAANALSGTLKISFLVAQ